MRAEFVRFGIDLYGMRHTHTHTNTTNMCALCAVCSRFTTLIKYTLHTGVTYAHMHTPQHDTHRADTEHVCGIQMVIMMLSVCVCVRNTTDIASFWWRVALVCVIMIRD